MHKVETLHIFIGGKTLIYRQQKSQWRFYSFIYLMVLWFGLWASLLLGVRLLEPHLQPFWLFILEIRSAFCLGQPRPQSSYFKLPTATGMTGLQHYTQASFCWDGVSQTLLPSSLGTTILPILASQLARITGMSNQHPVSQDLKVITWTVLRKHEWYKRYTWKTSSIFQNQIYSSSNSGILLLDVYVSDIHNCSKEKKTFV
jgi:hypothetical protein